MPRSIACWRMSRVGGAAEHEAARVLVDDEQLVDAAAAPVAGAAALVAALAAVERGAGGARMPRASRSARDGVSGTRQLGADAAHEPLGQHALEHRGDQVVLHAHVEQARDGARGVVGVQRGEDQVAGERGLDGDLGRLEVADLADHDDVGILADDVAQARWRRSGRSSA